MHPGRAPERIDYVDYKDVSLLERCVSEQSKIRAARTARTDSHRQRAIARAIKNAREMALLPYANRRANVDVEETA
jgi:small subunit ribosomal protein S18